MYQASLSGFVLCTNDSLERWQNLLDGSLVACEAKRGRHRTQEKFSMAEHYLAGLPAEIASKLAMNRVVGTKEAASICNLSVVHWRRLLKANKVPAPVRISAHKFGWRLGTLNDFIAQRSG